MITIHKAIAALAIMLSLAAQAQAQIPTTTITNVTVTPSATANQFGLSATITVTPPVVIPPVVIPPVVVPPIVVSPVTASAVLPGPNAALYAAPFYQCKANYYVSTTGKDTNAGTQSSPWLTIQHADSASRQPGDCINVAAGTYKTNIVIQHGGNAPTPTGYVVYRCQTLDGCHVLAASAGHLWGFRNAGSFTVVDGFELDGNAAANSGGLADACFDSDDATYGTGNTSHHLWVMNSILHDCNLSGVQLNNKEWFYVLHNRVYNNSGTSGYEGSGISLVVNQCIEAGNKSCWPNSTYQPSGMDLTFAPNFHNVVQGNVVYDNMEAANNPVTCGNHTDGNGIIIDTFLDQATAAIVFPYQTLVQGNLAYGNGGRGVHVFASSNVTVANNTAYGNGTDTCINAYYLADLSQAGGSNNVWVNNVAQAVMTAANPTCGGTSPGGVNGQTTYCGGRNAALVAGAGRGQADNNNTYLNFVLYGTNPAELFDNAATAFKPASNKVGVDPKLVSPPSNFALQPSSPAVGYAATGYGVSKDAGACDSSLKACP